MICETCADKGITRLNWADAPEDYALCLCLYGKAMRRRENNGKTSVPLYVVWCAREQVDPERVYRIEDVLTEDELQARGFASAPVPLDREARLRAAGKAKHR